MPTIARGTIRERPLAEIYWCLHWMRLRGCLEIEQPPHKKTLYFKNGVGFFARSTMKSEALGKFLQARRLISADAYDSATLVSIQEGLKLGEALVRQGALTQSALDAALLDQVRERFLAAFSLRQASWIWSPEIPEDVAGQRGQIPILPMIRDGIAKFLDFDTISAALLPWSQEVIVPTRSFAMIMASVELSLDEQRILSFVDGNRRLGDIIAAARLEPGKVVPPLYLAKCIGLLRGKNESEPRTLLEAPPEVATPPRSEQPPPPPPAPPVAAPLPPPGSAEPPSDAPASNAATAEMAIPPMAPATHGYYGRPIPPPRHYGGRVRLDEAVEIELDARPAPAKPPTQSFGIVRHDDEVVMDVSGMSPRQSGAMAPPPGARPNAPNASGGVQRVLDASQAFRKGESAFAKGELAKAVEEYDKALSIDATEPEYLAAQSLGVYFHETLVAPAPRPLELERAYASASRALQNKPGWAKALYAKALAAKALGKPEHSHLFEEAYQQESDLRGFESKTRARIRGEEAGSAGGNLLDRASKLFRR